ncbi:MAG: phosphate acetyltransferase [Spirochaetaceae bacterium]|jgi:phosphate acetyltransferase|nr:phosphate acetyltransferase [Spirochaetaceae bacterium]
MDFEKVMLEKARKAQKRLVLAEGTEPRTVKAARKIVDEKLAARVTLVGKLADIEAVAKKEGVKLDGINLADPETSPDREKYVKIYYDNGVAKDEAKRKKGQEVKKPMTEDIAKKDMAHFLRWGAMMVYSGDADAMVAGAESSTADVLRAGLGIIGTAPGSKTASSCFVMQMKDKEWGADGAMIFSDCAVLPAPSAEQLADIAASAAQSCREFLDTEPVVALMSFSTKGSAAHERVTAVTGAVNILKERKADFAFDGELQADAALVPSVTDKKAPGSPVRGKVNTLVFPDLGSGNIGYKLVQRLAKAEAFGPFLQGFAKPISDLSRGCSVEDIVVTSAVTLARAK